MRFSDRTDRERPRRYVVWHLFSLQPPGRRPLMGRMGRMSLWRYPRDTPDRPGPGTGYCRREVPHGSPHRSRCGRSEPRQHAPHLPDRPVSAGRRLRHRAWSPSRRGRHHLRDPGAPSLTVRVTFPGCRAPFAILQGSAERSDPHLSGSQLSRHCSQYSPASTSPLLWWPCPWRGWRSSFAS